MSTNRFSKIHSNQPPLDLPGGEIFSERSSNGAAARVTDQNMVTASARDGEQNTGGANHDLAELVWRYFENEIREALNEIQEETKGESTDDLSHRRQKGK